MVWLTKKSVFIFCCLGLIWIGAPSASSAEQTIIIAGAGPSTSIVTEFFTQFSTLPAAEGYDFVVPQRSIKHAGGIKAAQNNIFGRTGRPLTPEEKGDVLEEVFLGRIPLTFVVDPDLGVRNLTRDQLISLLEGNIQNWSEVGGPSVPVKLVGREPGEAALSALAEELPQIENAPFTQRLKKDHQLVQLMQTTDRKGVLGFGAQTNFTPSLYLNVEDLNVGLALGLVYHRLNSDHQLVQAVRLFAQSTQWRQTVLSLGMIPVL